MSNDACAKISQEMENMQNLLIETLDSNYLTDKSYTKITTVIGHIDDLHKVALQEANPEDMAYLQKTKDKLDKLCNTLTKLHNKPKTSANEDLMHPTGDYYNEDNSITLSAEDKTSLRDVIKS